MNDLLSAISWLFTESWKFFSGIDVPGLGVSVGALSISVLLICFGFKVLRLILGSSSGGDEK